MKENPPYFNVSKLKDYLYVIKENISIVHSEYRNDPLNMYLLLGSHTALLLDTGCGLHPIKPNVENLIGNRKLLIFNSHAHWDHVLGNQEFEEVYIHENEVNIISKPYDMSYLKNYSVPVIDKYKQLNYKIPPAKNVNPLYDGDVFDLGDINIRIIHAPGHSSGSICLLTNHKELFTSDVAYYGDIFLPKIEYFPLVLHSLSKLIKLIQQLKIVELYPSHRKIPCDASLLMDLYEGILLIQNRWNQKKFNEFFFSWQMDDNKFRYYISRF